MSTAAGMMAASSQQPDSLASSSSHVGTASSSTQARIWHTVSPSTRPLILEVLEITSLTLTIALRLSGRGSTFFADRQREIRAQDAKSSSDGADTLTHATNSPAASTQPAAVARQRRKKGSNHASGNANSRGVSSSQAAPSQPSPAASDDELTAVEADQTSAGEIVTGRTAQASFKELLSNGIIVTLNGQPWNRIVAHVDDEDGRNAAVASAALHKDADATGTSSTGADGREQMLTGISHAGSAGGDRAVVVIYGLEPGKEYQVDLRVVGPAGANAASTVADEASTSITASTSREDPVHTASGGPGSNTLTSSSTPSGSRSRANSIRQHSNQGGHASSPGRGQRSRSSSLIQQVGPAAPPATTQTPPPPAPIVPTAPPIDIFASSSEPPAAASTSDSAAQALSQAVSAASAERDELQAMLKRVRRDAQKAEAALQAETDALRRAMDKTAATDQRSRQKVLALQEQVKQAYAAAADAEQEREAVLASLPPLERDQKEIETALAEASIERDTAVSKRDAALEADRKVIDALDNELAHIVARLEKQLSKKERVDKENDELRRKLEDVASARGEVERRNEMVRNARAQTAAAAVPYGDYYGGRGPIYPTFYPQPQQQQARASAVLATQGIPHSGTTSISHLGNPTGFFASAGSSSGFRPLGASPRPTAAPFMPQNPSNVVSPAPSPTSQEHLTSLVPPQLQHRIYLPGNRGGVTRTHTPPTSDSPAFPPLPTHGAAPHQQASKSSAGPTLASIVTRAIIPASSALSPRPQDPSPPIRRPDSRGQAEDGSAIPSPWSPAAAHSAPWTSKPRGTSDEGSA